MTTITSCIIPTQKLARWRSQHPERYTFVLSDSAPPSTDRFSADRGCIRNRKAWLIDNTFYVSSRRDGTLPLHTPNPKEFHEMQWKPQHSKVGRFVEEKEVVVSNTGTTPPRTSGTKSPLSIGRDLGTPAPRSSLIGRFTGKLGQSKRKQKGFMGDERRHSWLPTMESGPRFADWRRDSVPGAVSLPNGVRVPNAIFARKYLLVEEGEILPTHLPISQMPVAESKATDTIAHAAELGLFKEEPMWSFRGPFTPQLGYDGGLDYQWPSFPLETQASRLGVGAEKGEMAGKKGSRSRIADRNSNSCAARRTPSSKKKGSKLGPNGTLDRLATEESTQDRACLSSPAPSEDSSCSEDPDPSRGGLSPAASPCRQKTLERADDGDRRQVAYGTQKTREPAQANDGIVRESSKMGDWRVLQNIKLLMPEGSSARKKSPSTNRKTTIMQLPPPSQAPRTSDFTHPRGVCPVHSKHYVSKPGRACGNRGDRDTDDDVEEEKLCTECIKEAEGPIVCDLLGSTRRQCSVSQGATAERRHAFLAELVDEGGFI